MTTEQHRRPPGQVRDAIHRVLSDGKPRKVADIQRVEAILGTVRPSSVRSYLQIGVQRGQWVQPERATYRMKRR